MVIIGIIVAILVFTIVVLIHELGHFGAARKFGVKVEEFGLGLPPRAKIIGKDKKGTLFTLNWLPIGGFVRLTGESPYSFEIYNENKKLYKKNNELEKDIKDGKDIFLKDGTKLHKSEKDIIIQKLEENKANYNLMNKPVWQQSIIILAGVFMNFLLAFTIFFVLFLVGVKPIGINDKIKIESEIKLIPTYEQAINNGIIKKDSGILLNPIENSIAQKAGLKSGDIIYSYYTCNNKIIDENNCAESSEIVQTKNINEASELIKIVSSHAGKNIIFLVNKNTPNESYINLEIPESGKIGTYLGDNIIINEDFYYKYGPLDSAKYALLETKNQVIITFKGIKYLLGKIISPKNPEERQEAISSVSGPIGIISFISDSLKAGIVFLFIFGAIISINLGVFNLLPIPALDGGRFFFIILNSISQKVFGKKIIGETGEAIIHFLFFIILIALSLIIAYNDISKIINN